MTTEIDSSSSPEIILQTFNELQAREENLKKLLQKALEEKQVAEKLAAAEKKARERLEILSKELADKCTEVQAETSSDKQNLLAMLTNQSEKIDNQVNKLTEQNEELRLDNLKLQKQVKLCENEIDSKDALIKTTSDKWKLLANKMKEEMLNLRKENSDIKDEMSKLIKTSIEDKQSVTLSLKKERELHDIINSRAKEMADMYKRSQEQMAATSAVVKDMKGMRKDILDLRKKHKQAEDSRVRAEFELLQIGKEKLELGKLLTYKIKQVKKLEDLCRALQGLRNKKKEEEVEPKTEQKLATVEEDPVE